MAETNLCSSWVPNYEVVLRNHVHWQLESHSIHGHHNQTAQSPEIPLEVDPVKHVNWALFGGIFSLNWWSRWRGTKVFSGCSTQILQQCVAKRKLVELTKPSHCFKERCCIVCRLKFCNTHPSFNSNVKVFIRNLIFLSKIKKPKAVICC